MMKQCTRQYTWGFLVLAVLYAQGWTQALAREDKLKVVTTLEVLKYLAREVGADRVEVQSLCDPRQDPHFVQPRPTLMKRARRADMFIEVGLQLELWAGKVIDGSGNTKIQRGQPGRVVASNGIATLELPRLLSREWGDIHPYGNPHVWLDPVNVKKMAANIASAFERMDVSHRGVYAENLKAFQDRIDLALFGERLVSAIGGKKLTRLAQQGRLFAYLDQKGLSSETGGWLQQASVLRGHKIVTYHKTWIYFLKRFGMEVPVEIEEKPGITPSARHRDEVIQIIRQHHIKAMLIASFYNRSVADFLAERTGATVIQVPIDLDATQGIRSYFDLMDMLIRQLTRAFPGRAND